MKTFVYTDLYTDAYRSRSRMWDTANPIRKARCVQQPVVCVRCILRSAAFCVPLRSCSAAFCVRFPLRSAAFRESCVQLRSCSAAFCVHCVRVQLRSGILRSAAFCVRCVLRSAAFSQPSPGRAEHPVRSDGLCPLTPISML